MSAHLKATRKNYEVSSSVATPQTRNILNKISPKEDIGKAFVKRHAWVSELQDIVSTKYGEVSKLVVGKALTEIPLPVAIGGPMTTFANQQRLLETEVVLQRRAARAESLFKVRGEIFMSCEPSFKDWFELSDTRRAMYDKPDITAIMTENLHWFMSGRFPQRIEGQPVNEDLRAQIESTISKCYQSDSESVQDFFRRFKFLYKSATQLTEVQYSEVQLAYSFITKLNKHRYVKLQERCADSEAIQQSYLAAQQDAIDAESSDDDVDGADAPAPAPIVRDPNLGYPQTMKRALALASAEELKTAFSFQANQNRKQKRELETEKTDVGSNFAAVSSKPGKKHNDKKKQSNKTLVEPQQSRTRLSKAQIKAMPPGSKPSIFGMSACNGEHKAGDETDHFRHNCPLLRADHSYVAAQFPASANPQQTIPLQPYSTAHSMKPESSNLDYERIASAVAPMIRSAISQRYYDDYEDDDYRPRRRPRNMFNLSKFILSTQSTDFVFDHWTFLLDSCASTNDFCNKFFISEPRANPNAHVPIHTVLGDYFCKRIGDLDFLGETGINERGGVNIVAMCPQTKCECVTVVAAPDLSWFGLQFKPINYTMIFHWHSRVLAADSREYARRLEHYRANTLSVPKSLEPKLKSTGKLRGHVQVQGDKFIDNMPVVLNAKAAVQARELEAARRAVERITLSPSYSMSKSEHHGAEVKSVYCEGPFFHMSAVRSGGDKIEFASQKALKAALLVKDMQERLGDFSLRTLGEAYSHGSIDFPFKCTRALIENADAILGADAAQVKGKFVHSHDYPQTEHYCMNISEGEVAMQSDIIYGEGRKVAFIYSVLERNGYEVISHVAGKSAAQIWPVLTKQIDFFALFNLRVKMVTVDGELGFSAVEDKLNHAKVHLNQLPRGIKPALVESRTRHLTDRVRTFRARYPFAIGAFLLIALYVALVQLGNIMPSRHNVGHMSAFQFLTRERARVEHIARHAPLSLAEVPVEALQANKSGKAKTVTCLALHPVRPHLNSPVWKYLTLDTFEVIERSNGISLQWNAEWKTHLSELTCDPTSKLYASEAHPSSRSKKNKKQTEVQSTALPLPPPPVQIASQDDDQPAPSSPPSTARGVEQSESPDASFLSDLNRDLNIGAPRTSRPRYSDLGGVEGISINADVDEEVPQPRSPQLMNVDANGTVSYSYIPRVSEFKPADRLSHHYTGTVQYDEMQSSGFNFAANMSLKKALSHWGQPALEALVAEIDGMLARKVWTGVLRSDISKTEWKKILRSHAFMKEKFDLAGKLVKVKCRIVADGSTQDYELFKSDEVSSPTISTAALFTVASQAAAENRQVMTIDVQQAYLEADMINKVLVRLDPVTSSVLMDRDPSFRKFLLSDGCIIVKLNKAQYGCVESARLWYNTVSSLFERLGFTKNHYDPCVFDKVNDSGNHCTICLYVDDIKVTCVDASTLDWLQQQLSEEFNAITVKRGAVHEYLGMIFDYSKKNKVLISMEKYTRDVLNEYDVRRTAETPASSSIFEIDNESSPLTEADRELFHRAVAQTLYLATRTRPDILLPVIFLTTRVRCATVQDQKKLNRVFHYLNQSAELGIKLGSDVDGKLRVITFADASYGVHENMKSHSGTYISVGSGPVYVKSASQKIVTKSSTEAELVTLSDSCSITAWLMSFLESLGVNKSPAIIMQDNVSTMRLAQNGRSNSDRTKHIKLRYFFIKQYLDSGEFQLQYCPTDVMIADILTKPLQGNHFLRLRDLLLGYQQT